LSVLKILRLRVVLDQSQTGEEVDCCTRWCNRGN